MANEKLVSKCCGAEIAVWEDDKGENGSHRKSSQCTKCGNPCEVVPAEQMVRCPNNVCQDHYICKGKHYKLHKSKASCGMGDCPDCVPVKPAPKDGRLYPTKEEFDTVAKFEADEAMSKQHEDWVKRQHLDSKPAPETPAPMSIYMPQSEPASQLENPSGRETLKALFGRLCSMIATDCVEEGIVCPCWKMDSWAAEGYEACKKAMEVNMNDGIGVKKREARMAIDKCTCGHEKMGHSYFDGIYKFCAVEGCNCERFISQSSPPVVKCPTKPEDFDETPTMV